MTPRIECEVSGSVRRALTERVERSGSTLSDVVDTLLSEALLLERHSLFQVSTSNALVEGVFGGVTTVADLKRHGDFGLGTFAGLDGEMIMVEGECFRVTAGGLTTIAADDRATPFALVTRFSADLDADVHAVSLESLVAQLDRLRPSENLFVGIRVDGVFDVLAMRAICAARPGEGLVEATSHQSEFEVVDVRGTIVGFWAPEFAKSVSVTGYHFHFISAERDTGGHVLGLEGRDLHLQVHTESDLHLALPESVEFLTADLSGDHEDVLDRAERAQ
ncbi:MAG: acetolactate decarboxylase [Acidimicrobiia bacterium]